MLRTTYLNLKKPEGSDPVNVQDFNDNADTIDTEVNARVKSSGGDIANTKVSAFTASTASYPVPAAGETPKVFMGKIKKFFEDFKSFKDSIVTKTMIINQILNDSTKAASAATVYSVNEKVDSAISDLTVKDVTAHFYKNAPVSYVLAYKIGHMVQCIFTISAGSSGWVEVAFCDDDVRPLMDVPVYRARSTIADDNAIQVNGTLKAAENKLYIYISKALSTNLSMSCIYPTTR